MLDEQNQLWSVYFVCQWNLSVNKVVKKKRLSWGICYFISNVTRLQSVSYECKKTKGVLLSPYGWVGKQCWHPNLWIRWLKKEAMQEFQSDSVGVSSTNFNLSDLDFEVGGQRSSFLKILWMLEKKLTKDFEFDTMGASSRRLRVDAGCCQYFFILRFLFCVLYRFKHFYSKILVWTCSSASNYISSHH